MPSTFSSLISQTALKVLHGSPRGNGSTFDPGQVRKILLIRRNGIGDMICALPLIRGIRSARPDVRLDMLAGEGNARILNGTGLVERIFVYRRGGGLLRNHYLNLPRLMRPIHEENYDLTIAIKGGFSSLLAVIAHATQIPWRLGYVPSRGHRLDFCFNLKAELPKEREHQVESCLRLLKPLGIPAPSKADLSFPLTELQQEYSVNTCKKSGVETGRFMLFNPSAVRYESRWTASAIAETARQTLKKHGLPTLLAGLSSDMPLMREAMENSENAIRGIEVPSTIHHFAALVSQSRFLMCGDGGPMHVAAAMSKPVFVLFSATDPQIWRPYGIPFAHAHHGRLVSDIPPGEVMEKLQAWMPSL